MQIAPSSEVPGPNAASDGNASAASTSSLPENAKMYGSPAVVRGSMERKNSSPSVSGIVAGVNRAGSRFLFGRKGGNGAEIHRRARQGVGVRERPPEKYHRCRQALDPICLLYTSD